MSYREPTLFADNAPRRTMREAKTAGGSRDRVGWRQSVAVAIKQHLGEQAGLASAGASVAPAAVAGELCLHRIPQRLIDDRRCSPGWDWPL